MQAEVWLEINHSLQIQNPEAAANILQQQSTRTRGQPQKKELPQKDKHINVSNNAAKSLFGKYDFKEVATNNIHNNGFNYIRKALNYLSASQYAPKILQKFSLGDSLLLHIELYKSLQKLDNEKSYENKMQKQILANSVLSIDDSTIKKPRKMPKPYSFKRDKSISDNTDNKECKQSTEQQFITYDVNATNLNVIRNLVGNNSSSSLLDQVVKVKNEFNKGNSRSLYKKSNPQKKVINNIGQTWQYSHRNNENIGSSRLTKGILYQKHHNIPPLL